MSISRTYKLPWVSLDPAEVAAAATAVAAAFPGLAPEPEVFSPTAVHCYFVVPRRVPDEWKGPAYEVWFAPGRPPAADPLAVEIHFTHLPPDVHSPNNLCLMSADMGHSANRPLWPLVTELMGCFCRRWGIEPERW